MSLHEPSIASSRLRGPVERADACRGTAAWSRTACAWQQLAAWRATRLNWTRFGLAALLVFWAGHWGGSIGPAKGSFRVALALSLIAQFRLWDDIVDRKRDRIEHPERVLARVGALWPFVAACVGLGGINALLLAWGSSPTAVAGYALLCVAIGAWYRVHAARSVLHVHVLNAKYPAFVLLLVAGPPGWAAILAAVALYAAICSFELIDDGTATRVARLALGVHGAILAAAAAACGLDVVGAVTLLVVAAICAAAASGGLGRLRGSCAAYAPFVALVIVFARFHFGGLA